jgi:hypothetical protein
VPRAYIRDILPPTKWERPNIFDYVRGRPKNETQNKPTSEWELLAAVGRVQKDHGQTHGRQGQNVGTSIMAVDNLSSLFTQFLLAAHAVLFGKSCAAKRHYVKSVQQITLGLIYGGIYSWERTIVDRSFHPCRWFAR